MKKRYELGKNHSAFLEAQFLESRERKELPENADTIKKWINVDFALPFDISVPRFASNEVL